MKIEVGDLEDLKSILNENLEKWDKNFVKSAISVHQYFYQRRGHKPLIVKQNERVISFAAYALCSRFGYLSLVNIFTLKEFRGFGIGDWLWNELWSKAIDHPKIKYFKWLSHETSLCFYKKHGYTPKGKLPNGDYLFVEPVKNTTPEESEIFFNKMRAKYKCVD